MLKVIIVEDEMIIRNGLMFLVDWIGLGCIIVGTAEDGEKGLELILQEKPDIVITDIRMPRMSGLEMIEEAQKSVDFHSVILTSYAEFKYAQKAISLHAFEYILKPVDQEEMVDIIQRISTEITSENHYQEMEKLVQENMTNQESRWMIFEKAETNIDYYVKKTYSIIKEHYTEKLSINDAAEQLEVSSSYLSRHLKQNLNSTFVDLLNQYRVYQAMNLMKETGIKVYEVSDRLGFGDYKQFGSLFKKYTGMTPTDFMKQYR